MSEEITTEDKPKMGAPTKYNEELLEKAKQYLHVYEGLGDVLPTIEGLALYLDISRETLYRWCGEEGKSDFNDTVKKISLNQKSVLINKGLSSKFNSKITQLLLGANHSVIEKQQTEVSGPGGKPIEQNFEITFIEAKKEDNKETD